MSQPSNSRSRSNYRHNRFRSRGSSNFNRASGRSNDGSINDRLNDDSTNFDRPNTGAIPKRYNNRNWRDAEKKVKLGADNGSNDGTIPKRSTYNGNNRNWRDKSLNPNPKLEQDNDNEFIFRQPRPNKLKRMTFTRIEELLSSEDPNSICVILQNKDEGFTDLLQNSKDIIKDDWIVLILRLIEKVISSTISMKKIVIIDVCYNFFPHLIKYLQNLPFQSISEQQRNKHYWNNPELFWKGLLTLCNEIVMVIPKTGVDVLPKLLAIMNMNVTSFATNSQKRIKEDIIDDVNQLTEKVTILISAIEAKALNNEGDENVEEEIEEMPFGDYRDIPILPEQHELVADKNPDIRPNIVNGKYLSIYHYLDVQFRLLREDFIAPLREGIRNYLSSDSNKPRKFDNIRIYKNVQIKSTTITKQQQFCFVVQLNLQKKQLERLEYSKRLMYGSLLIFTNDSFKTLLLGTLVNKDENLLKNGEILVDIPLDTIDVDKCLNVNYIMVESEIYFEPYRHILKSLQTMTEDSFPMSNYILKADTTSKPPRYLLEARENGQLPLLKIKNFNCNVLDNQWTLTAQTLKYDDTQYQAFKSALTKEFCVIQGPPGTGKTFIGLQIMEALLVNNNLWYKKNGSKEIEGPILVVCYTNHALDQFLEGVLEITNRVARIGGQSKNEKLNNFNIRELRRRANRNNAYHRASVSIQYELNDILKKIQELRIKIQQIQLKEPVIIDVRTQLRSRNVTFTSKAHFLEWLLNRKSTGEDRLLKLEQKQFLQILNESIADDDYVLLDENVDEDDHYGLDQSGETNDFSVIRCLNTDKKKLEELWVEHNRIITDQRKPELIATIETMISEYQNMILYLEFRFNQRSIELPPPPLYVRNKEFMSPNERWALYWQCLAEVLPNLINQITKLQAEYKTKGTDFETVQQMEDLLLLRNCLVVGMTTTGAAKFHTVLEGMKSPIVIVEEAAEVLESHIVTSLTSNCKHLILIGDHAQLRPSTSVYRLAKYFQLDISLFERMIKNGMHYEALGVQHRMRPEFAQLIVPSIYPNLENHCSVYEFPSVTGMKKNLFFIKHDKFEEQVVDIESKQNVHEANFMLQLCRHLILQGYEDEDITVLTTYNGQMFLMKKLQKNIPTIQKVRITAVDNFQGEESKIILLSLVRSNEEGKIGFLATSNRICVALSRAKHGFYIIGNMDKLLKNENSKWPEINQVLERNESIGTELVLQCQVHRDQLTKVNCADDFQRKCPEGGCALNCNLLMPCGHRCSSMCHVQDRDHTETKCLMPCSKIICERQHLCPDFCFKECEKCVVLVEHILPCSHKATLHCYKDPKEFKCPEIITVKLPCEHENRIHCSDDPNTSLCTHPCISRLNCGHTCMKRCHIRNDPDHLLYECRKPCEQLRVNCSMEHKCDKLCYEECNCCNIIVQKQHNNCQHVQEVKCYQNIDDVMCEKKCTRLLECKHPCQNLCGEVCDQTKCKVKVQKPIPICGHTLKMECGKTPQRKNCTRRCPLKLPCGHVCNNSCSICAVSGCLSSKCLSLVPHSFVVDCNHQFMIPCFKTKFRDEPSYSQNILKYCKNPCNFELACGHICAGNCGECYQGRLHKACDSKCNFQLVCGHPCKSPCRQNCPPCMEKCQFRCVHNRCTKKCGEPCTSCKEPCVWRCQHFKCINQCGDFCNRPPCNEPCMKSMSCGHLCIGLCGETCPNICRVCDPKNEIFEIMFGDEDEEMSRFIKLEDCGHVFEVNGLDTFFDTSNEHVAIDVLKCPRCRVSVVQTLRYSNKVKQIFIDISKVKKKAFGKRNSNNENAETLREYKIKTIIEKYGGNVLHQCDIIYSLLRNINKTLDPIHKGRKRYKTVQVTAMQLSLFDSQLGVIELILEVLLDIQKLNNEDVFLIGLSHVNLIGKELQRQFEKLNKQQTDDLTFETNRMVRIREYGELLQTEEYKANKNLLGIIDQKKKCLNSLLASKRFINEYGLVVKQNLLDFQKLLKNHGVVSDQVKKDIARILQVSENVKQGAWFKCPNGHLYCIGECGGAMEVGRCIECSAPIGGSSHRILSTNTHASEMGGRNPWPQ